MKMQLLQNSLIKNEVKAKSNSLPPRMFKALKDF